MLLEGGTLVHWMAFEFQYCNGQFIDQCTQVQMQWLLLWWQKAYKSNIALRTPHGEYHYGVMLKHTAQWHTIWRDLLHVPCPYSPMGIHFPCGMIKDSIQWYQVNSWRAYIAGIAMDDWWHSIPWSPPAWEMVISTRVACPRAYRTYSALQGIYFKKRVHLYSNKIIL